MAHYRKNPALRPYRITGFSLVEVLVTIVILLIGLLGLAGLQGRALNAQMESYQRSQALILLKDMADRIEANRANAAAYVTTGLNPAYLGTDNAEETNCSAKTTRQLRDSCEWNNALLGAAEKVGGNKVGAMIGARGCIYEVTPVATGNRGLYVVTVAWQGLNSTAAPVSPCGQGKYGNNEALRRVVSLPVGIAYLQN